MKPTFIALLALCLCLPLAGADKEEPTDLRAEAEKGNAQSQYLLGYIYTTGGFGIEKDLKEAEKWYRKSAEQGHAMAQVQLGLMYRMAKGVKQDFKEAVKWFRKAAVQGNGLGQANLGFLYEKGQGVEQDIKEGVKWIQKAAEQAYPQAQYILGMRYFLGKGVKKDHVTAYAWVNIAEKNGMKQAKDKKPMIGKQLTSDQIAKAEALVKEMIKKNPELLKDFKSLKALAEKGDAKAQFEMGQAYRQGQSVSKDNGKAAKWYHMAAEKGSVDGSYYLGVMYFNGDGVDKDLIRAYVNLSIAAKKKNAKAIRVKQIVVEAMTPQQILTGNSLLKNPERRTHFKFQPDCMAALRKSVGLDWVKKNPVGFEVDDPKGSMIDFVDKDSGLRASWATVKLANGDELYIASAGGILIKDGRNAAFAKQVFRANVKDSTRVAINLHQNRAIGYHTPLGITDFLLIVFTQTALQSDSRAQFLKQINKLAGVVDKKAMPLPKDFKSLKALAVQGDAEAQFKVGQEHANGNQGFRDIRGYEAATWWRQAADQGHARAMENLGLLYAQGKDLIQKNDVKAYAWLTLSVASGNQRPQKKLAGITNKMTPKQVEEGQELSKKLQDWIKVKRKPKAKTKPEDFVGTWHSITPPAPIDSTKEGGGEKQKQEFTKGGIVRLHYQNALVHLTWGGHWKFVGGEALATIDMGAKPKTTFKIPLPNIPKNPFLKPPDSKGKMTKSTMSLLLNGNLIDNHGNRFKRNNVDAKKEEPLPNDIPSLKVLAENGDARAQFRLGQYYLIGHEVKEDDKEAVKWWGKSAEQGYAKAQYSLGTMYNEGKGVLKDPKQAVKWWRKAAVQGVARAQYNLGSMYAKGKNVEKDSKEAVKWWRKAAEQGVARAQFDLGGMYAEGKGVLKDSKEAVKWFLKAADQGYADAQYNLGVLEDNREAVKWFRKAAGQGHAAAQYNLGIIYAKGEGVLEDNEEAIKLYLKAAEQGHVSAQSNLGVMYAIGKGVKKDYVIAYTWWNIAALNGSAGALKNKTTLAKKIAPNQIAKALILTREMVKKNPKLLK